MMIKDASTPELSYFSSDSASLAETPLNRLLNIETDCLSLRQELISIISNLNEDKSPLKTVSIINSLAVISLSERMDEIARIHASVIVQWLQLDLHDLETVKETSLRAAINRNPFLFPFEKNISFIVKWLITARALERQENVSNHGFVPSTAQNSHGKLKLPQLGMNEQKYIKLYNNMNSLDLPLLVHWALFYGNVENELDDTEKLFERFLNGLVENNAFVCRRKGSEFQIVCSSENYFGKDGLILHPVSKVNRIKSIKSSSSDFSKFEKLYSRYITALSNCLTFANCSGKLTSVEQLYHRPPKFYPGINQYIHSKRNQYLHGEDYPILVGDMKSNLFPVNTDSLFPMQQFEKMLKTGNKSSSLDKIKSYLERTITKNSTDIRGLKQIRTQRVQMISELTKRNLDEIEDLENKITSLENEGDLHEIAGLYHDLGKAYRRAEEPKKGIISYEKSIEIRREISDIDGLSKSYNNMGLVCFDLARVSSENLDAADETQKSVDDAECYFNLSLDIKRKNNLNSSRTLRNLANLKIFAGRDSDEIISTFDEALALSMDIKDKRLQSSISIDIVNYYQNVSKKDIFEEKSRFDGRLIESHQYLDSSEIIDLNLNHCSSFIPFVIEGSAGMGKTIVMTQLALKYVNELEKKIDIIGIEDMKNLAMPIYIKGARIGKSDFQVGGEIKLAEMICNSNPEINKYLTINEIQELIDLWNKFSIHHLSNYSFFVDALDEISDVELAGGVSELICGDLVRPRNRVKSLCFISTRPSHTDVIASRGWKVGFAKLRPNYYSKEELSELMPVKLCDAWGITRELTDTYRKEFDTFYDILIHPLFVGWFCFLIIEDKLSMLNLVDNDVDGDHEIFNSNLEYKKNVLLGSIIEIGIDASLKRKERSVKDRNLFTNLVKRFVSISFHYSISDPKLVFQIIEEQENLEISDYDKQSIMHECGILFLTGENIVWTHTTIPEIIYAEFFFEQEEKLFWGPMKTSKPVLYRYALSEVKSGNFENYSVAVLTTFHKYLSNLEFSHLVYVLDFDYDDYKIIDLDKNSELVNLVSPDSYTLHHLVNLYLDSLSKPSSFSIRLNSIYNNSVSELLSEVDSYDDMDSFDMEGFEAINAVHDAGRKHWEYDRALSLKLYNVSNSAFGSDIHPFRKSIPPEFLDRSRINSSTPIQEILAYYRAISESTETDDSILDLHEISNNYDGIFTSLSVTATSNLNEDLPMPKFVINLENKDHFLSYINELHVEISYGKLFGSEKFEECIERLWQELVYLDTEILGAEYMNSVHENVTNFITSMNVFHLGKNFDIETNFSEDKDLKLVDKGRILMPFVRECLNHLEGKNSVLSPYIEESGFWMPYEMIKSYASNLD
jgi:tetratricopeptide (TPR) repeat protein